jgi:Zn-dependent protease with chaperone function
MLLAAALAALALTALPAAPSFAVSTLDPYGRVDTTAIEAPVSPVEKAAAAPGEETPDRVAEVLESFTPENRAYAGQRRVLSFLDPVYSVLAMLLLLFSGASARMRDLAERVSGRHYVQTLVYLALFFGASYVLALPFEWYRGYRLEHLFGLSNQSLGAWFGDSLKDILLSLAFFGGLPIAALAYVGIRKSPRRWWLWLAAGAVPVMMLAMLLGPLVFEPAFNKFEPLKDEELKAEILALAEKAEIPGRKVLQADKSEQTNKYNAYVSGFGVSQRIVLWDTTLKGMEKDEILFVMAHEMGHYKLGHIWKLIAFSAVGTVFVLFFTWWLLDRLIGRFGHAWGVRDAGDLASMPALFLVIAVVGFLGNPVSYTFTRSIEHEADIFGLEVVRDNDAAARAFIKLGSQNKTDPAPGAFVKTMLYTHPPLVERVRFATEYRPWERGEPNRKFKPRV